MKKNRNSAPNYKKIFEDIINFKFPKKAEKCKALLKKKFLTSLDVIKLNNLIFDTELSHKNNNANSRHRSYDKETVCNILKYQKDNNLNNRDLATHFKTSRNTISKWKREIKISI